MIEKPQEIGGHDPRWVAAPQKNKNVTLGVSGLILQYVAARAILNGLSSERQCFTELLCRENPSLAKD